MHGPEVWHWKIADKAILGLLICLPRALLCKQNLSEALLKMGGTTILAQSC